MRSKKVVYTSYTLYTSYTPVIRWFSVCGIKQISDSFLRMACSGDFCFRVLHPEVSGPPDMKKASGEYRDFIFGTNTGVDG
ncbi:hypothetical protein JFPO14_contig00053-0002 [Edwardsiella piscicida]|nr:hypothetical protein JFPO14_contig00053-0002 [Edwardsiella piscicida]